MKDERILKLIRDTRAKELHYAQMSNQSGATEYMARYHEGLSGVYGAMRAELESLCILAEAAMNVEPVGVVAGTPGNVLWDKWNEALDEAAKLCEKEAADWEYLRNIATACGESPVASGMALSSAMRCAAAIRALKGKT